MERCCTGRHCQTNFADPTRFIEAFSGQWPVGTIDFQVLFIEFNFMLDSYTKHSISSCLFSHNIPRLVSDYKLEAVWVPAGPAWLQMLSDAEDQLVNAGLTEWVAVEDPHECQWYEITEMAEPVLNRGLKGHTSAELELQRVRKGLKAQHVTFFCLQKPESIYGTGKRAKGDLAADYWEAKVKESAEKNPTRKSLRLSRRHKR